VIAIAVVLFGLSFSCQTAMPSADDTNLASPSTRFPDRRPPAFPGKALCERLSPPAVGLGALTSSCCSALLVLQAGRDVHPAVQCATCRGAGGLVAYRGEAALFRYSSSHRQVLWKNSYSFYLLHPLALWSANWVHRGTVEAIRFTARPA